MAAEKIFAQRGYRGASIRDIAEEAGVPLALVGYYFGQKHELFHAIFEHWNSTIQERLASLSEVRKNAKKSDYLEGVIDAFLMPVLRLRASPEGKWYALLLSRGLGEASEEIEMAVEKFFDPLAHAFISAIKAAYPKATRGETAWCYQFMLGALLHHLSDTRVERLSKGENTANDPAAAGKLKAFMLGGVRAAMKSQ